MKTEPLSLDKRRDKFDALVKEHLRSKRKTVDALAKEMGCDPSSLWRYRKLTNYFKQIPFDIICTFFRIASTKIEDVRYVMGLIF